MERNRHPATGSGSSVQLGGERTEPTPKRQIAQRNDCQPAMDAISVFAPWSGPEDRPLRMRLHRAGTAAVARATRSKHGNARQVFWLAAQMAQARTFARVDVDHLQDGIAAVSYLFLAANIIERTELPDVD